MPSPLNLYTWKSLKISAFGIDKKHAIEQALIGIPNSKIDEIREQLETINPVVKQSNLRK
jgi:hypothetical protein